MWTPCRCPSSFAGSHMQRSHGTIEAGPTRGQGRSLGIIKTTNNLWERYKYKTSNGIEKRAKGTTSMGVIACRSREASLTPNYIPGTWYELMRRRNVTGVILDPKGGDAGSASPGVEKSLRTVQRERDDLTTVSYTHLTLPTICSV